MAVNLRQKLSDLVNSVSGVGNPQFRDRVIQGLKENLQNNEDRVYQAMRDCDLRGSTDNTTCETIITQARELDIAVQGSDLAALAALVDEIFGEQVAKRPRLQNVAQNPDTMGDQEFVQLLSGLRDTNTKESFQRFKQLLQTEKFRMLPMTKIELFTLFDFNKSSPAFTRAVLLSRLDTLKEGEELSFLRMVVNNNQTTVLKRILKPEHVQRFIGIDEGERFSLLRQCCLHSLDEEFLVSILGSSIFKPLRIDYDSGFDNDVLWSALNNNAAHLLRAILINPVPHTGECAVGLLDKALQLQRYLFVGTILSMITPGEMPAPHVLGRLLSTAWLMQKFTNCDPDSIPGNIIQAFVCRNAIFDQGLVEWVAREVVEKPISERFTEAHRQSIILTLQLLLRVGPDNQLNSKRLADFEFDFLA